MTLNNETLMERLGWRRGHSAVTKGRNLGK